MLSVEMVKEGFLREFIKIGRPIGIGLIIIALFGFTSFLVLKVTKGEGLQYYFTGHGYEFSYLGALILICLVPIIIVAALTISWWQNRGERELLRKYGKSKFEDNT